MIWLQCVFHTTLLLIWEIYMLLFSHTDTQNLRKFPSFILCLWSTWREYLQYSFFFFSRAAELIPEIAGSDKIIRSPSPGYERAITNAVSKTWPNIPLFRSWIHAWQITKFQLVKCNIREKKIVSKYVKSDYCSDPAANFRSPPKNKQKDGWKAKKHFRGRIFFISFFTGWFVRM